MKLRGFLLLSLAVVLCSLGYAQSGASAGSTVTSNLKLTIDEIHVADSLVNMKVSVTNTANTGIAGLESSSFMVSTDSDSFPEIRPAVSRSDHGIALVICLDTSGSMPLDNIRNAIHSYLGTLRPQDRVAVITFNDDAELVSGFTSNFTQLRNRIGNLETSGSYTELYKGVYTGLALLRDETPEGITRRYLLVMSDGKNEYSSSATYELDHCVELAQEVGVPIMSIGYTERESNEPFLQSLENMSDRTGGSYLRAMTAANLGSRIQETLRILNCQYQLNFEIPPDLRDSREHTYKVTVQSGGSSGSAEFNATGEGVIEIQSGGLSLLWIIVIAVVVIGAIVVIILYRRSASKKINVLNDELLSSKDNIEKMRKEQRAAEEARARAELAAAQKSKPAAPPKDKGRFRRTMVGEVTTSYKKGTLHVLSGADKGQVIDVTRPVTTIGHAEDNTVALEKSVQSTVSGHHAVLRFAAGQFQLEDQNSSNGTMVNGKRITSMRINDGDRIRFGKVELVFKGE